LPDTVHLIYLTAVTPSLNILSRYIGNSEVMHDESNPTRLQPLSTGYLGWFAAHRNRQPSTKSGQ